MSDRTSERKLAYHGYEDGESGNDFGPEPVGRLDVLAPLQHWVVHKELLTGILFLTVTDVSLDLLLKFRSSSFLQNQCMEIPCKVYYSHIFDYIYTCSYVNSRKANCE